MSAIPDKIGRYRIEAVLGRGAMGVIYKAHDPEIDRPVAIKLIRADLLDGENRADYLVRFRREAQAAGRCAHPNIVAIYDFAMHEGNPFLAMEFVEGVSLSQARERGTEFEVADAVFVMLQVLDALSAAHAMGIVHRDIKPANIMLVGGSRVKVTDFGISRFDSSDLTQDGSVVGTPSYMSPEQYQGLAVDARSDLFSAGAVLYELLCGERPFAGRNFAEIGQNLLHADPPDLRERSVAVSPALKSVVDRALAKSPDARYATAAEMAAALRSATRPEAAAGGLDDRTIVVPSAPPARTAGPPEPASAAGLTGSFDIETLSSVEHTLARYVGPIARLLVRAAIQRSGSVEALCDSLAGNIEQPGDRDRFRADALARLRRGLTMSGTSAPAATIPAEELEHAQKELTHYLGPIARVLVKRAAAGAGSAPELWQRLSLHIDREEDRHAFLSRRRNHA
ncbi:MAG TPA: serine/threonine-protein kinase [Acetobacteraceae bacterium]|nr:serine/threonine-protein kinase [Acetobacteraceae bacterium]